MPEQGRDLISMADIARLAGQSRATVGNWKSRQSDFPPERGRGTRGPLYERSEVTQWLEATGRLDERPAGVERVWALAAPFRDELPTEAVLPLLLVLLTIRSESDQSEWKQLQEAPPDRLEELIRSIVRERIPFGEVLLRGGLSGQSLAAALAGLSQTDAGKVSAVADALLEQAVNVLGRRGGEYLCPASVRKLVVEIADPSGSVYNPASGIGQLMVDTASASSPKALKLLGQEVNSAVWAMGQLNLRIHGLPADIALGDVFSDDRHPDLRADRVIAMPPWNQRLTELESLADDPRWVWGEPGANDANAAWIQHCLHHLADGGRAVLVLPNRVQFEGGRAGRIRQRIIKAGLLDAVIALPAGHFPWTSLSCSLLVFVRGRPDVDGKPAPTLMVDLTDDAKGDPKGGAAMDTRLQEVSNLYRAWTRGAPPESEIAAVADFDELAANDFVIDPGRYLPLPIDRVDLDDVARRKAALTEQLDGLLRATRSADDQLQEILADIR